MPGKRKWGRPTRKYMDAVRQEMAVVEVTEEDREDRTKGDGKSAVLTPDGRI